MASPQMVLIQTYRIGLSEFEERHIFAQHHEPCYTSQFQVLQYQRIPKHTKTIQNYRAVRALWKFTKWSIGWPACSSLAHHLLIILEAW